MFTIIKKLVFLLLLGLSSSTSTSYLSPVDKNHLRSVLDKAWSSTELSLVSYAVSGYKFLSIEIPDKQKVCDFAKSSLQSKANAEELYFASQISKTAGCAIAAPSGVQQVLSEALRDDSPIADIYYAVSALKNFGLNVDDAKVSKLLQQSLKKDDNIQSLGYAFHIGAHLKGDKKSIYERMEDAIVQADEVDGKMLQFEGGLSNTAFILTGVYKLAEVSNKPVPMKADQAVKFANYLLSRKTVQFPKGAFYLLDAVNTFTDNKYHIPVSISLASSIDVSPDSPKIRIRVANLLGASLPKMEVTAVSASGKADAKTILSQKKFTPVSSDPTLYELDVMASKPSRGFYESTVNAVGSDARLVGNHAVVVFKVLSTVALQEVQIGTADSDQTTNPKLKMVSYPELLPGVIDADHHQRLVLKFWIKDTYLDKDTKVHQSFVKITHKDTQREIIFVAEQEASSGVYKFDLDLSTSQKEFGGVSGIYSVELIIGDASISNSVVWKLANVNIKLPQDQQVDASEDFTYRPRPEIHHQFRTPDPKPPKVVSLAFAALCFSPLLILLVGWGVLGVNMSNFPFSLSSIGFHLGLGGIFGLFCWFWLQLNMFTTLRYLFALGIVTFLCGNSMLSSIAEKRKEK